MQNHEYWIQRHECFKNRLASLCKWYENHIQGFIQRTIDLYNETEEQLKKQQEEHDKWESRLVQISEKHEKLKSWRMEQIQTLQTLEQQMSRSMAMQFEKDLKEAQRLKLEKQKKKEQIQAYHGRLDAEKQKQRVIQETREALELRDKQKHAHQNKKRVAYRHQEWNSLLALRKQKELNALQEKMDLEKRLDKLRSKVYVEAESDPDRLLKDTIAFSRAKDSMGLRDKKLFSIIGFTHDQLMQDKRYCVLL
jgi:hypothetical protein